MGYITFGKSSSRNRESGKKKLIGSKGSLGNSSHLRGSYLAHHLSGNNFSSRVCCAGLSGSGLWRSPGVRLVFFGEKYSYRVMGQPKDG